MINISDFDEPSVVGVEVRRNSPSAPLSGASTDYGIPAKIDFTSAPLYEARSAVNEDYSLKLNFIYIGNFIKYINFFKR
jgi:hypothetical protein